MIIPDDILNFTINDIYHGFAQCNGILYLNENFVVIEYFIKDNLVGLIKSDIKKIYIKYSDIICAELKKSLFSKKLIIKLKSLSQIYEIPFSSENNELSFSLKNNKDTLLVAETLATYINSKILENKLYNIENNF